MRYPIYRCGVVYLDRFLITKSLYSMKNLFNIIFYLAIVFLLCLCLSCGLKNGDEITKVSVFYNPSGMFFSSNQHLSISFDGNTFVDTLFDQDSYIDKSLLLKCLDFSIGEPNKLAIDINGKDTIIHLKPTEKCVSLFIDYNDHYKLFEKLDDIENFKQEHGVKYDYQNLLDSLVKASERDLKKIGVDIRSDTCWCKD